MPASEQPLLEKRGCNPAIPERGLTLEEECPCAPGGTPIASSMYGQGVCGGSSPWPRGGRTSWRPGHASTTRRGMPNAWPRSMTWCSRVRAGGGGIPQPVLVTMITTLAIPAAGLTDQARGQNNLCRARLTTGWTMVMPSPPGRYCTRAVPGALTYCFRYRGNRPIHSSGARGRKCRRNWARGKKGAVAVMAIWRLESMSGCPSPPGWRLLR